MGDRQDVIRNPKYIILTDSIVFGPSMDGAMPILLLGSQSHQQMPRHESGLINNHDTSALASASAAAMYATRRNPLTNEALAKPLGNEGRHGPVKLRGVVFLTESIVASVL